MLMRLCNSCHHSFHSLFAGIVDPGMMFAFCHTSFHSIFAEIVNHCTVFAFCLFLADLLEQVIKKEQCDCNVEVQWFSNFVFQKMNIPHNEKGIVVC